MNQWEFDTRTYNLRKARENAEPVPSAEKHQPVPNTGKKKGRC